MSYGKHESIIVVKWNSGPYKPMTNNPNQLFPKGCRYRLGIQWKRTLPGRLRTIANITIGGKSFAIQQIKKRSFQKHFTKSPTSVVNLMADIL
jgi:hypothetical protein